MLDQMLPPLITLFLLLCLFLWALLIDFLLHLRKSGSLQSRASLVERRKRQPPDTLFDLSIESSHLADKTTLPQVR